MTAREYLSQAYRLDQRIHSKLEQIESLSELATRCTSAITGMPRNPSPSASSMAEAVDKIVDLQNEINQDMLRLVDLKRDIVTTIKAVDDMEYQTLLELRYLCFKTWEQIASDMHYSARWVHIVHSRVLAAVDKMFLERSACG